jgi:hypothetical protein
VQELVKLANRVEQLCGCYSGADDKPSDPLRLVPIPARTMTMPFHRLALSALPLPGRGFPVPRSRGGGPTRVRIGPARRQDLKDFPNA